MKDIIANNLIKELKEISSLRTELMFYIMMILTMIDIFLVGYYATIAKTYNKVMLHSVPIMIFATIIILIISLISDRVHRHKLSEKLSKHIENGFKKIAQDFQPGIDNCKRQYEIMMFPIINKALCRRKVTLEDFGLFVAGQSTSILCDLYKVEHIKVVTDNFYRNN